MQNGVPIASCLLYLFPIMSHAYTEEVLEDGSTRVVMKIPEPLAPVKVALFPLVKKDGLPEIARGIMDDLKLDFNWLHYQNTAAFYR